MKRLNLTAVSAALLIFAGTASSADAHRTPHSPSVAPAAAPATQPSDVLTFLFKIELDGGGIIDRLAVQAETQPQAFAVIEGRFPGCEILEVKVRK